MSLIISVALLTYVYVAFLAEFKCFSDGRSVLTAQVEDSDPSISSRFLSLPADLFFLIRLNSLSIPVLEFGVTNISFAILNISSDLCLFPTKDLNCWMWWYHKVLIRYSFQPSSYSLTMATSQTAADSSESLKDLKSLNFSNNFSTL